MGQKRNDKHEMVMRWTWLATTACCTTLHDVGWSAEDIAEVMPHAMKELASFVIDRCYGDSGGPMLLMLDGDAIHLGQGYANAMATSRAGVTA